MSKHIKPNTKIVTDYQRLRSIAQSCYLAGFERGLFLDDDVDRNVNKKKFKDWFEDNKDEILKLCDTL